MKYKKNSYNYLYYSQFFFFFFCVLKRSFSLIQLLHPLKQILSKSIQKTKIPNLTSLGIILSQMVQIPLIPPQQHPPQHLPRYRLPHHLSLLPLLPLLRDKNPIQGLKKGLNLLLIFFLKRRVDMEGPFI